MHRTSWTWAEQMLFEPLLEYEEYFTLTRRESWLLHLWVKTGHDVCSNPWGYCFDDDWQMDYITALRFDEEMYETIKRMAEES